MVYRPTTYENQAAYLLIISNVIAQQLSVRFRELGGAHSDVALVKLACVEKFAGRRSRQFKAFRRLNLVQLLQDDFLETAGRASDDARHLVITRRKNAFLMMNRYPYTVGHLMVVPYRKVAELSALGENEVVELWNLVVHAQALLRAAVKAQGFNIGLNLGECAGAGVPDHLHIHVVPRWTGDTNFMPIIGGARVLSDGLRALYDKMLEAQANMTSTR